MGLNTLMHFANFCDFSGFDKMKRLCYCGEIVPQVPCKDCRPKRTGESRRREYDRKWRVCSENFRAHNPLCFDCSKEGKVTPSQDVHHIVPIREAPHLRLDPKNLVALCRACHNRRHKTGNL